MVLRQVVQQGVIRRGKREVDVTSESATFGDVLYPWAIRPGSADVVLDGSGPIADNVRRWALRRGFRTTTL